MAAIVLLIIGALVIIGTPDLKAKLIGSRKAVYRLIVFGVIMLQVIAYWASEGGFTTIVVGSIFTGIFAWMEASYIASEQTVKTTIVLILAVVFGRWNTLLIAAPGGVAGIIWINLWLPAALILGVTILIGWVVNNKNKEA